MPERPPPRPVTGALVLDLVRTAGTISRVELAERSGLAPATITHVVRELIAEGLLHEVGRARSNGGSPRRLLELVAGARYAVGVQLDRCAVTVVVTDFLGRRVAHAALPGVGRGTPGATLHHLARRVEALLRDAAVPRDRVLGVGLVTHGPQDRRRGVILTAQPTAAWRDHPLTATLSDLLGMPVLLENDATAAAVGEQWAGDAGSDTFGVLYMASGIGGGVVHGGRVYGDGAANPVEIGHVPLGTAGAPVHPARCACGSVGCTEALAGPAAVVARAAADPRLGAVLRLTGDGDATLAEFERVAAAADAGDPTARALVEESAGHLGTAAVTLMNLFDLDTVVLAGAAFATVGPLYVRHAERVVARGALARLLRPVRVRLSADPALAAAVGGALVVLRSDLSRPGVAPAATPGAPSAPRPVAAAPRPPAPPVRATPAPVPARPPLEGVLP